MNLPSIWYEVQLVSESVNIYGVSLPGAPNVIVGFNDNIAWGVTNAEADVMDWYQITFKDSLGGMIGGLAASTGFHLRQILKRFEKLLFYGWKKEDNVPFPLR